MSGRGGSAVTAARSGAERFRAFAVCTSASKLSIRPDVRALKSRFNVASEMSSTTWSPGSWRHSSRRTSESCATVCGSDAERPDPTNRPTPMISNAVMNYLSLHATIQSDCNNPGKWPDMLNERFAVETDGLHLFPNWQQDTNGSRLNFTPEIIIPWETLKPYLRKDVASKLGLTN